MARKLLYEIGQKIYLVIIEVTVDKLPLDILKATKIFDELMSLVEGARRDSLQLSL